MPASRDLEGLRVVITRPEGRGADFAQALHAAGAQPILLPTVRIQAIGRVPGLEQAVRGLERYRWAIFTSANGVELFWDWLGRYEMDGSAMRGLRVAAIGPATADALRERDVEPDFVPQAYVGEALAEGLPQVAGQRVLLARAAGSRPTLPQMLEQRGAQVDEFHLYRAVELTPDSRAVQAVREGVDALTFTSPSTLRGFVKLARASGLDPLDLPGAPIVACIGPITAEAAAQAGLAPAVVAERYTVEGLVEALTAFYRERVAQ